MGPIACAPASRSTPCACMCRSHLRHRLRVVAPTRGNKRHGAAGRTGAYGAMVVWGCTGARLHPAAELGSLLRSGGGRRRADSGCRWMDLVCAVRFRSGLAQRCNAIAFVRRSMEMKMRSAETKRRSPEPGNGAGTPDQRGRGRTVERRRSLRESHWFNVS